MSLGQLPAAAIVTLTDKLVAGYEAAAGTSGSGLGLGDGTFGLSKKMNDFANLVSGDGSSIYGLGDSALQAILDPLVQSSPAAPAILTFAPGKKAAEIPAKRRNGAKRRA